MISWFSLNEENVVSLGQLTGRQRRRSVSPVHLCRGEVRSAASASRSRRFGGSVEPAEPRSVGLKFASLVKAVAILGQCAAAGEPGSLRARQRGAREIPQKASRRPTVCIVSPKNRPKSFDLRPLRSLARYNRSAGMTYALPRIASSDPQQFSENRVYRFANAKNLSSSRSQLSVPVGLVLASTAINKLNDLCKTIKIILEYKTMLIQSAPSFERRAEIITSM